VVPSEYGGCDDWGWTGADHSPVKDVALEAAERYRGREVAVRFHPAFFTEEVWGAINSIATDAEEQDLYTELLNLESLPKEWAEQLAAITGLVDVAFAYNKDEPSEGFILAGRRKNPAEAAGVASTEDDKSGSDAPAKTLLSAHASAVTAQVHSFLERAGLDEKIKQSAELAAELHDSGKGDRRFQEILYNGGSAGAEVIAKSDRRSLGPVAERQLRERVGLPPRWRHEALSVRIARLNPRLAETVDVDADLALWLIGTHHGYGRPFFPHDDPLDDCARSVNAATGERIELLPSSGPQRPDFDWKGLDWVALFDTLRRRYGTWGLARLEAFVRLADHRASEETE
jgi:CRISPR-associated endonuclease/helicase Cas3